MCQLNKQLQSTPIQGSSWKKACLSHLGSHVPGREAAAEAQASSSQRNHWYVLELEQPSSRLHQPEQRAECTPERGSPTPEQGWGALPRTGRPPAPDCQQHQDVKKAQLTASPWQTVTSNAPAFNTTLVLHQWVPL